MFSQPFQQIQISSSCCICKSSFIPMTTCSLAHCNTSKCPPNAADVQTPFFNKQPNTFTAHFKRDKCPTKASCEQYCNLRGILCLGVCCFHNWQTWSALVLLFTSEVFLCCCLLLKCSCVIIYFWNALVLLLTSEMILCYCLLLKCSCVVLFSFVNSKKLDWTHTIHMQQENDRRKKQTEQLPIFVSDDITQHNPAFTSLLVKISKKLTHDGVSSSVFERAEWVCWNK